MVLMDPARGAESTELEDEDMEILGNAVRVDMTDPTYLRRVRDALEKWKARH